MDPGEERVQAEWPPHPVCAGGGGWMPTGILPAFQTPY